MVKIMCSMGGIGCAMFYEGVGNEGSAHCGDIVSDVLSHRVY